MYYNADRLHGVLFWLFGSFAYLDWLSVIIMIIVSVLSAIMLFAKEFNVLLGRAGPLAWTKKFKTGMFILGIGAGRHLGGLHRATGSVGLIVPHLVRMDHRRSPPAASCLHGGRGNILLPCDIAKTGDGPSPPIG